MEGDGESGAKLQDGMKPGREMLVYYALVALYFFAFGLQFVIFPSLVTFQLQAEPRAVGLAQMSLSAPMFALLLVGGVMAGQVRTGPALCVLQILFALPPLALAVLTGNNLLQYNHILLYGVTMGALAAFMLPVRDSALNGVVAREAARGGAVKLERAAATTTAVQLGAQIAGMLIGARAGSDPAPFLTAQALAVLAAAALALLLKAPRPDSAGRTLAQAAHDIRDGLTYAFRDPVMGPLLASAAYIGVFVIGSFQVLFPLIIRDAYGGDPVSLQKTLGAMFATFFVTSFVSAVIVSRFPPRRSGRAMLIAHMIGAVVLGSFAFDKPLWGFSLAVGIWGLGSGVAMSMSRTITQSAAAPQHLGRVLAVYAMGFMGGAPLGSFVIGFLAEAYGPRAAALAPAIGLMAAAVALAVFSPIWRMERGAIVNRNGGA
jgi:MFS family permease